MADHLFSTAPRHDPLPENYVRPESQLSRMSEVVTDSNFPVINLSLPDKSLIISQISYACENYGFFQVVNHGITEQMLIKVMGIGRELLPEEKAKLYSDDSVKKMRLSTSFNLKKEKVYNWRDYLRLHCDPLEDFVPDWPSQPELLKEIMSSYCTQLQQLGFCLFGYISQSLGLKEDYIEKVLGKQEHPQNPEAELTYGLPDHSDPNALTIRLQDQQVTGLQVLKEGKWIAIDPVPWALIINIGDQLQALSNGRYKSVWHRAVVNSNKERMCIASFLSPCNSALICPPKKHTEWSPAIYRSYTYDEYYKKFLSRNLDQEHCLELFTTNSDLPDARNDIPGGEGGALFERLKAVGMKLEKLEFEHAASSLKAQSSANMFALVIWFFGLVRKLCRNTEKGYRQQSAIFYWFQVFSAITSGVFCAKKIYAIGHNFAISGVVTNIALVQLSVVTLAHSLVVLALCYLLRR